MLRFGEKQLSHAPIVWLQKLDNASRELAPNSSSENSKVFFKDIAVVLSLPLGIVQSWSNSEEYSISNESEKTKINFSLQKFDKDAKKGGI